MPNYDNKGYTRNGLYCQELIQSLEEEISFFIQYQLLDHNGNKLAGGEARAMLRGTRLCIYSVRNDVFCIPHNNIKKVYRLDNTVHILLYSSEKIVLYVNDSSCDEFVKELYRFLAFNSCIHR